MFISLQGIRVQLYSFLWSVGVATFMGGMVRYRSLRVASVALETGPSPAGDTMLLEFSALGY